MPKARFLGFCVALWILAATPGVARAADGVVIFDQRGYVREWIEFGPMRVSPKALEAEGESLFSDEGKKPNYRRIFGKYVGAKDVDWGGTAWMKDIRLTFFRGQWGDDSQALRAIPEIAAADGWAAADFDDSAWLRRRLGSRKPVRDYQENFRDSSDALVRNSYYRTYFEVTDPTSCGDLVLSCRYRGGIRVWVNGTEVVRSHLPAGKLGPEIRAEHYPREAYFATKDEVPGGVGAECFGDLRCPFDEAPESSRHKGYRRNACNKDLNRQGWQRLLGLRDRDLGPVTVPAKLLRPGRNVLAVEVRGSDFHPCILPGAGGAKAQNWASPWNPVWSHACLVSMQLRAQAKSAGAVSALERPAQARLWVADVHDRLFSNDFAPAGWPVGQVRIVAVPNGTFAAQLAVAAGAESPITGLEVKLSDLKGPAGASVPASALSVLYAVGHPMADLWKLGYCRSLPGLGEWGQNAPMAWSAIWRQLQGGDRQQGMTTLEFFDHLAAKPPPRVSPGRCQPIWLSLRLPGGTPPGRYTGSVRVQAEGMTPAQVTLNVEVIGWRVPSPNEFQTIVQSEQSPYGVAKHYKLAPWSKEHFRLIDSSFRQLARLGADWVFVPVLLNSEFGNRGDAPIRWIRRKDGSLAFDYAVLDLYLDLATKRLGKPRVICFNVMHGAMAPSAEVEILDESTGSKAVVDLGPKQKGELRRPYWKAFVDSLMTHMRAKGMDGSVYWGQAFDNVYDLELIRWMEQWAPGTSWAAAGHGRNVDEVFCAVARAYGSDVLSHSQMGWRHPAIHLLMPRTAGSIICVEGTSTPFTYRVLCDRAIYAGFNGIGRMGADYFDLAFYDGCRGGEYQLVGRSCIMTLWPGGSGIDTSTRNEVMLEGIQEAEARIFLEQALQRKALPPELSRRAEEVLNRHCWETLYIPASGPATDIMEFAGGWQARSRRLYAAAAEAAKCVALDLDRVHVGAREVRTVVGGRASTSTRGELILPALGSVQLDLRLRNWTGKPRRWRAGANQPWIVPQRRSGAATGHEAFAVVLDGSSLKPGKDLHGILTLTDLDGARDVNVSIAVTVGKAVELRTNGSAFNVPVGASDSLEGSLVNHTNRPQRWAFSASADWLTCRPASGLLPAGGTTTVRLSARAPGDKAAIHRASLAFDIAEGAARESVEFAVYVIPPYRPPTKLSQGPRTRLKELPQGMLKSHHTMDSPLKWALADKTAPCLNEKLLGKTPVTIGGKTWQQGMWVVPHHETTYDVKGRGFSAFVAHVGVNDSTRTHQYHVPGRRVCFEVFVDGKLRATSGLMGDSDPARTLVVDGLGDAREVKLVTRMERLGDSPMNNSYPGYLGYVCNWADPAFHK